MRAFDYATVRGGMAGPGGDTRHWCSHGTVDPDTPGQRSVTFDPTYGPLVNVTLRPSGVPVVCRVAYDVAGNGEGEWVPFLAGDEVQVLINEGSETAGCTIVGRLNNEIDAWPRQVAGMDATKNNFGFRRMRFPYVVETSSNYLIRDATTGAFIGLKDGAVTISNSDKGFLAMSQDVLGLQSGDATTLMQIDVANKRLRLQANGAMLTLDASSSSLLTKGTLAIATAGNQPSGHAVTLEQVVALLNCLGLAIAASTPGALTGATLGAAITAALQNPVPPGALPAAAVLPLASFQAALAAALQVPPSTAAGSVGAGCTGLQLG